MPRLFVAAGQIQGDRVIITGDDAHYVVNVLRRRRDDLLSVVGPDGSEYMVRIDDLGHKDQPYVETRIVQRRQPQREPAVKVTIAQALIKGDKMDLVVQKGTELGCHSFIPFAAKRSVVRLDAARGQKRVERWRKIAVAAAQQSGRLHVPEVTGIYTIQQLAASVEEFVDRWGPGSVLLAWEGETAYSLFDALNHRYGVPQSQPAAHDDRLMLVIGPEGGFEQQEADLLRSVGATSVTLGPLIFRTETAGMAVLSMILYHVGDLGRVKKINY